MTARLPSSRYARAYDLVSADEKRLDVPFVAWDGEGITYPGNTVQSYCLFGASTGDRIIKRSLPTADCLELMCRVEDKNPTAIHVGFALGYDVNMILKDVPKKALYPLWDGAFVHYEDWKLEYRPGKWFQVSTKEGKRKTTCKLFDVFGFFQSSFVKACTEYLGEDDPLLTRVIAGKAARRVFEWEQLEGEIVPYWKSELSLLVRLMDSLRNDLHNAGIPIKSWHGPGAVANQVLRQFNIQLAKAETPKEVNIASQFAYAGGRFEQFGTGYVKGPVYEYDINSAYPSIIRRLPDLSKGHWEHVTDTLPDGFGIWRVCFDSQHGFVAGQKLPQPIFYRDRRGRVSFPPFVSGWYWTPEASLIKPEQILEGWRFIPDDDDSQPFGFVDDYYRTRRQWKQDGNSAQRALKLALNSLYGKMAQRTGYRADGGLPKWHQLEWAGYVTSSVRRKLWDALDRAKYSTIALETDAIFTLKPLDLPLSDELGDWDCTVLDDICYVQSGFYYAHKDGKLIEKYRGFDKGSVPFEAVIEHMNSLDRRRPFKLSGPTTRFVGLGLALHTRSEWRSWERTDRRIMVGGGGKRAHLPWVCDQCKAGFPLVGTLHQCVTTTAGGFSHPHPLPWEATEWDLWNVLDECQ